MVKILKEKDGQTVLTTEILIRCIKNIQGYINRYSYKEKQWRNARYTMFDGEHEEYRLSLIKYKKERELIVQVLSWYYEEKDIIKMVKILPYDQQCSDRLRTKVIGLIEKDNYFFEK